MYTKHLEPSSQTLGSNESNISPLLEGTEKYTLMLRPKPSPKQLAILKKGREIDYSHRQ